MQNCLNVLIIGALILLVGGCGGGGGSSTPSPIAWWKAENNAQDSAGNADGTVHGGVTYAAGVSGQAFNFDGVDGAISVPDLPQLALTGSFTIDVQVCVTSLAPQAQGGGMVLFRGDDRGGLDPYYLSVNFDGNIRFHIQDATAAEVNVEAPIAIGRFVHVIASLDASTGAMKLFLDGILAAQVNTAIRPFHDLDPATHPGIGIGNSQAQPVSSYQYPFHGLIDEMKVFNVVVGP
jgi:hypothetical protein